MTRNVVAVVISASLAFHAGTVMRASYPASTMSLALVYDLTLAPVAADLRSDSRLKLVLDVVAESLANRDTVRVGFLAGNVSWSRAFGVADRVTFYSDVVRNASVPVDARLRWPALCDGLYDAVTMVRQDEGRRAVVVVASGHSGGNVHSLDELVTHAREAHVSLSAVHAPWPGDGRARTSPDQYLTYWSHFPVSPHALLARIATATGGTYIAPQPHVSGDLKQRLNNVLAAIRQKE